MYNYQKEWLESIKGRKLKLNTKRWSGKYDYYKIMERYEMILKSEAFVKHIEQHLKDMNIDGKIICKICGKTIDEIYEESRQESSL